MRLSQGRDVRRRLLKALGIAAATLLGLALIAAGTPQGSSALRTVLFLPQVLPSFPIRPQGWVTRDPVRHQIEFPLATGQGTADLYVPAGSGRHSAVLFFMGVVPPDRDERRIVALAEGLARSGMVVMIPWLDSQKLNRIASQDIDGLVRAFQHLRGLDRVDPERVGMGGICTGASLSLVAAQDERIADDVRFVNFFAGYYDASDLVKAVGSRSRFYGQTAAGWDPNKLTMRLFTDHLIDGVTDPVERQALTRILKEGEAPTDALLASLSNEATAVYRMSKGVPVEEVDELMAQLSPRTIELFRLISPATHIDRLKARVLIMHDSGDRLVPSEESRRLADALADRGDTYHTEFSFFQREIQVHTNEGQGVGPLGFVREASKFFMHMYNVMREVS